MERFDVQPSRWTATVVGILFLAAAALTLAGQAMYTPFLGSPEFLDLAHPGRSRVVAGVLVEVAGIVALPFVAFFLYPVLRGQSRPLALGYVALRTVEAALLLVVAANLLTLVDVSRDYLAAPVAAAAFYDIMGNTLQTWGEKAFLLSTAIAFPVGALVLNALLWRGSLVPRLISGWGALAAVLLLAGSVMEMTGSFEGVPPGLLEGALAGPIALQEVVLAIWLLARGFGPASGVPGESGLDPTPQAPPA